MTMMQCVVTETNARFHRVSVTVPLQANFLYSLIHHHKTEVKIRWSSPACCCRGMEGKLCSPHEFLTCEQFLRIFVLFLFPLNEVIHTNNTGEKCQDTSTLLSVWWNGDWSVFYKTELCSRSPGWNTYGTGENSSYWPQIETSNW